MTKTRYKMHRFRRPAKYYYKTLVIQRLENGR